MSENMAKKKLSAWLGVVVSVAIIVVMLVMVPWGDVFREMRRAEPWYFVPVVIATLLNLYLRALRWHYLLPASEPVPTMKLYGIFMIANLATFLLPMRAGEIVRPALLARQSSHRFSVGFASVLIERFFDLAMVLLSFFMVMFFVPEVPALLLKGAVFFGAVALGIFAVMLLCSFAPKFTEKFIQAVLAYLPSIIQKFAAPLALDFVRGAAVLTARGRLALIVGLTLLVWLTTFAQFYYFLPMFHLEPSVMAAVTTGVIVALAVAMPSAPGFVGVYQTGCVAAFALLSLPSDKAVAYSIVSHVVQYLIVVGIGAYYLLRNNLSLTELRSDFDGGVKV